MKNFMVKFSVLKFKTTGSISCTSSYYTVGDYVLTVKLIIVTAD